MLPGGTAHFVIPCFKPFVTEEFKCFSLNCSNIWLSFAHSSWLANVQFSVCCNQQIFHFFVCICPDECRVVQSLDWITSWFFPSVFTVYQDYFALASFFCFTCSSSCFDTLFRFSRHAMQIIIEIIAFTLLVTILVLPYFEERTLWLRWMGTECSFLSYMNK